jgi:PAS domain-containing protein
MGSLYTEIYRENLRAHLANPKASFFYSCWLLASAGGKPPLEEALLRHKLGWLMSDLMVLRQTDAGALVYEHYGANIAAVAGFDMTGKRVTDFKGVLGEFYLRCYAMAIEHGAPLVTVHRLGNYNERPIWERVIMPVRQATGGLALYVVNSVRRLGDDFAKVCSGSKGSGLLALQFTRDPQGEITDALIAGANPAALELTGRRLDELLDRSIRECFPGVVHLMLWERYLEVSRTRQEQSFQVDYRLDGINSLFEVRLFPFHDGVAIEFRVLPRASDAADIAGTAQDP